MTNDPVEPKSAVRRSRPEFPAGHSGTPPSWRPRAHGVRFASVPAGPVSPPFRSLMRVAHRRPARPASRPFMPDRTIGELKEACWFLLGPAPFTSGGRTGKRSGSAVSPTATPPLNPPLSPGGENLPHPFRPLPLAGKGKRRVVARRGKVTKGPPLLTRTSPDLCQPAPSPCRATPRSGASHIFFTRRREPRSFSGLPEGGSQGGR
jgi:hypothetical protein